MWPLHRSQQERVWKVPGFGATTDGRRDGGLHGCDSRQVDSVVVGSRGGPVFAEESNGAVTVSADVFP